ncbi:hypothetical protein BGZ94_002841 [Podila epigama]|nr:hypothetical protein BGZ94_002841 [Podila epigama]
MFKYVPGWTETMVVLLSACLGGCLIGLAESRALIQHAMVEDDTVSEDHLSSTARRLYMFVSGLVSMAVLGLVAWMIANEVWCIPVEYFAGIGVAAMALVQVWVPEQAVKISTYMARNVLYDDGCHDEEKGHKNSTGDVIPSSVNGRNACSLDASAREGLSMQSCHQCMKMH